MQVRCCAAFERRLAAQSELHWGMREVVRINSGFGEGGDGGINNGCIQEVEEGKGVDGSSVGLGLTVLVLFFVLIPPRSLLLWLLPLLLEFGILSLALSA